MAIAYVRDTGLGLADVASSNAKSFSTLPVVNNHVFSTTTRQVGTGITVADNQSNTWQEDKTQSSGNNGLDQASVWSAKVATSSGTFTVTATLSAGTYSALIVTEFSGIKSTSWLDQTGSGSGGTGANAATVTAAGANAQNDELIIAVMAVGSATNPTGINTPSGYTQLFVADNPAHDVGTADYKIVSAGETSSAAWNHATAFTGYGWAAVIATYKAAAGGTVNIDQAAADDMNNEAEAMLLNLGMNLNLVGNA